jgi:hypothetical protein
MCPYAANEGGEGRWKGGGREDEERKVGSDEEDRVRGRRGG